MRLAFLLLLLAGPAFAQGGMGPGPGTVHTTVAGYTGPGDITSFQTWYGLRAYSGAVATPGTNVAVSLIRLADSHTCDMLITTAGGIGNTTNCSTGGDNGQSAASWQGVDATGLGAITGSTLTFTGGHQFDIVTGAGVPAGLYIISGSSPTWALNVTLASPVASTTMTLYNPARITAWTDQANIGGTQHNATQATTANQAFYDPVCLAGFTLPCAIFGDGFVTTGAIHLYSITAASSFFSGTPTNDAFLTFSNATNTSPGAYIVVKDVTNSWDFGMSQTGNASHDYGLNAVVSGLTTITGDVATLNACHGVSGSYDGANLRLYHDGTQDTHSPSALTGSLRGSGSNYNVGAFDAASHNNQHNGLMMEFGMAAGAWSGGTQTSVYSNQTAFWGC